MAFPVEDPRGISHACGEGAGAHAHVITREAILARCQAHGVTDATPGLFDGYRLMCPFSAVSPHRPRPLSRRLFERSRLAGDGVNPTVSGRQDGEGQPLVAHVALTADKNSGGVATHVLAASRDFVSPPHRTMTGRSSNRARTVRAVGTTVPSARLARPITLTRVPVWICRSAG